MMVNENKSWYLDHNIQTFTGDPKGTRNGNELTLTWATLLYLIHFVTFITR